MSKEMVYHDHPDQVGEDWKGLSIKNVGGDYLITLTDFKRGIKITFRYCINGGFEFSHPKTTKIIADLDKVFKEENK